MVYPYHCQRCDFDFDVVKHHSKSSKKEKCPKCKKVSDRVWTCTTLIGTAVEDAQWNPGLGIVTKSARHRKDEAKARGLEEVGNERPEKTRKDMAKKREEKRKKAYEAYGVD